MNDLAKSKPQPYPETADIETSNDDYAKRFSGSVGAWMLRVQEKITLAFIGRANAKTILDVGGGHGQLAIPLCREKYNITVLSSDASCAHRIQTIIENKQCRFLIGNVIELPFEDRSFDAVICFRLVTHCERWPTLIKELCRVARHTVIVDYPTSQSLNAIAPMLFGAKKKFETNTRTWTLFKHRQILDEFAKHGFRPNTRRGQFFFPMVLHRMLKCQPLSALLETMSRILGLNYLWGSPVIIHMTRLRDG